MNTKISVVHLKEVLDNVLKGNEYNDTLFNEYKHYYLKKNFLGDCYFLIYYSIGIRYFFQVLNRS